MKLRLGWLALASLLVTGAHSANAYDATPGCRASAEAVVEKILEFPKSWAATMNEAVAANPECAPLIAGSVAELLPTSAIAAAKSIVGTSGDPLSDEDRLTLSVIALNAPDSADNLGQIFGQYLTPDFKTANDLSITAQNLVQKVIDASKIQEQEAREHFCGDPNEVECYSPGNFGSRKSELQYVPSPN